MPNKHGVYYISLFLFYGPDNIYEATNDVLVSNTFTLTISTSHMIIMLRSVCGNIIHFEYIRLRGIPDKSEV